MFAGIAKSVRKLDEEGLLLVIRVLIIVLGTAAFIQLGREVTIGATQHFDEAIIRSLRQPDNPAVPRGPVWFQDVARDITSLGGYSVLILLVGIVAGFLQLDGKKGAVRFLAGAVLSGYVVGMGLKAFFTRPRPSIVPHLSPVFTTSFPSGHSMMSAIVYLTLGALLSGLEMNHPRLRRLFHRRASGANGPGRSQPRLSRRALSDRRFGRLDGGPGLGHALLPRRPAPAAPRRARDRDLELRALRRQFFPFGIVSNHSSNAAQRRASRHGKRVGIVSRP